MQSNLLPPLAALLLSSTCLALDARHAGTYVVLRSDGQSSDLVSYLSQQQGSWNIEQRNSDGSWKNVTCDDGCQLKDSSPAEMERFLPAAIRAKYDFQCVNNKAFAFCYYQLNDNPRQGGHALIGLVTAKPQPIWLKKLSQGRQEAYQPGPQPSAAEIGLHISSKEGGDVFASKYWSYRPNKAFASSLDGAWGHSASELASPESAADSALRFCEQSRIRAGQIAPCKVVDINGNWQKE